MAYDNKRRAGGKGRRKVCAFCADKAEYIDYKDTAYMIVRRYDLKGISDDGLLKNYQRWKDKMRRNRKRDYNKHKKR